ncbi:RNA polymerase sigma-70 factor [Pedobacter sp. KBW06]|uniref:RNA polymerase sigma-70 factor n=1 Tax=Pedobacter sp. KBW06 TaxID=2153359 RepID=UPI00131505AB|nr:RNA polymerase sigma-70 factor [Pedobacter sp. KBW06]
MLNRLLIPPSFNILLIRLSFGRSNFASSFMGENNTVGFNGDFVNNFDGKAFEDLYRRMYPTLRKYAVYLVKDPEEAQLILNDVFIAIWKNNIQILNEKAYLFRAVKNASTNYHKTSKTNFLHIDEEEVPEVWDEASDPAQNYQDKDRNRILYQLIDQMPERRRLVFYMYRIDGFSYKEIADLLDISVRTVEDHLVKGFQFLQERVLKNEAEFR